MDTGASPYLPIDTYLTLHEEWEQEFHLAALPLATYSDDLEAIHLIRQEVTAAKNKKGEPIQHRAWPLGATFRGEAAYPEGR
ncbi:hypothetical protein BJ878DRAFT_412662 [Calycina marina]|uniref:Uncharacterized protein n=1 Tax=Calycina marina TaxID=1763456 RepID=A0A9P7ZAV2_9HELO|nr:hypothetical protein BJ878DRAFT_412662 [Calycina marina]